MKKFKGGTVVSDHSDEVRPADITKVARRVRMLILLSSVGGAALSAASGTVALAQVATQPAEPPAKSTNGNGVVQEEIIVNGKLPHDELITHTQSISPIPVPIIETTQTLSVLTAEDLQIAGINSFADTGRLDSGGYQPNNTSGITQLYYRGFVSSYADFPLKIDGFRSGDEIIPELFIYDNIQILKGSAATNYGQVDPGGTEIAISKSPKDYFGGSASVEAGSYAHYLANLDVYGPLAADGQLSGRLVAVGLTSDSSFDYYRQRRYTFAPSLRYAPTEDDEFLLLASYSHTNEGMSFGFPLALNEKGPGGANNGANYSIPDIPFSQLGNSTPWAKIDKSYDNVSLTYTHTFTQGFADGWKIKAGFEHSDIDTPVARAGIVGAYNVISTDKTKPTDIYLYFASEHDQQWAGDVNLLGKFEALGQDQDFSIGGDYTVQTTGYLPGVDTLVPGSKYGFNIYQNNFDVLPGVYSSPQQLAALYGQPSNAASQNRRDINYGIEAQVLLHPMDGLTINLGGRYSMSLEDQQSVFGYPAAIQQPLPSYQSARPDEHALTFQGGGSYAVLPLLHAYFSYGNTFEGGNSYAFDPSNPNSIGKFLGPVLGETYEVGLKGENASQSYNYSFDLFDTSITNAFQQDPDHPRYSIAEGAEEAKGWEFEFRGKINPAWTVLASASQTWNVFTAGPLKGLTSPFAPRFGLTIFTTYQFQSGMFDGLGAGIGLVHKTRPTYQTYTIGATGTTVVDYPNSVFKTNINEVDLRVFYDANFWRYEVSVNNLLNERYASQRFLNNVGDMNFLNDPTQVTVKLTRKF